VDRQNWIRLLCFDLYCTTTQAQTMIDTLIAKQVIGIGGLTMQDVMAALWSRIVDTENMYDFFCSNMKGMYTTRYINPRCRPFTCMKTYSNTRTHAHTHFETHTHPKQRSQSETTLCTRCASMFSNSIGPIRRAIGVSTCLTACSES